MDKERMAIERLRAAAEMSESYYGAPLIITTSGGKDSDVCLYLARAAGIKYEVNHSHTTADAPETVRHVRQTFKRLEADGIKCTVDRPEYKGRHVTMWSLIPQKLMPPTRRVRYCCNVLKENSGAGRMIVTGVRWAESAKRKKTRGIYESMTRDISKKVVINNDNDDRRRLFETCQLQAKRVCNPIIDWLDTDVWDYIGSEQIDINPLYQCGFRRVGCIGCPMSGNKRRQFEFTRYPTFERAYIRAFDAMLAERYARGMLRSDGPMGTTGRDVMHWWMEDGVLPGQMEMEEIL